MILLQLQQVLNPIKYLFICISWLVALGVMEWKKAFSDNQINKEIQTFMDQVYMSRIGIRVLIGQHVALMNSSLTDSNGDYSGIICKRTNVKQAILEASENAQMLCQEHFGLFSAPKIEMHCPSKLDFMYIPSHLNHMLFELLKNSLRAVAENYKLEEEKFPPVRVIVAEGKEVY